MLEFVWIWTRPVMTFLGLVALTLLPNRNHVSIDLKWEENETICSFKILLWKTEINQLRSSHELESKLWPYKPEWKKMFWNKPFARNHFLTGTIDFSSSHRETGPWTFVKLLLKEDNLFQYLIIKTWLEHIHKV